MTETIGLKQKVIVNITRALVTQQTMLRYCSSLLIIANQNGSTYLCDGFYYLIASLLRHKVKAGIKPNIKLLFIFF